MFQRMPVPAPPKPMRDMGRQFVVPPPPPPHSVAHRYEREPEKQLGPLTSTEEFKQTQIQPLRVAMSYRRLKEPRRQHEDIDSCGEKALHPWRKQTPPNSQDATRHVVTEVIHEGEVCVDVDQSSHNTQKIRIQVGNLPKLDYCGFHACV